MGAYSLALRYRGYPDHAREIADEALRLARRLGHLRSLARALFDTSRAATSWRQAEKVENLASELIAVASEQGFVLFWGWGLIFQGWAEVQRRPDGAAVERIREGLAAARATGSRSEEPAFLGLLAEAVALTGDIGDGLSVLADALASAKASGARGNDAELYRLRGDLLRLLPSRDWTEVETCFRTALAVARKQGARGFELPAAVSLARFWRDQGKRAEARDLLAPIYSRFTEGFDTSDLKDAKALLDELA